MWRLASSDQLLALVNEVRGQLVVSHELLEAHQVEAARAQAEEHCALCELFLKAAKGTKVFPVQPSEGWTSPKVGGDAEDDDQHGVVDVEAVGDEREHLHGAHDL